MTVTLVIQDFKNIPLHWSLSQQFPAPDMKTAIMGYQNWKTANFKNKN